jgi:osmotically-inducible protein OsmY
MDEVIRRCLWEDPEYVTIDVKEGVVTLRGQLGLRSLIPLAVRLTAAIDGVVDVVNELTYLRDDTTPEYQRFWR